MECERSVGRFEFVVRSYECGPDGSATVASVCNYLQEAASLHAEDLGFSKSDFAAVGENISWVLTRLRVRMRRFPRWRERVSVVTFPRGGRKVTALRDFEISVGGEAIGAATSEWMLIDLASRRLVAVPQMVYDRANLTRPPALGDETFTRVRWDCAAASAPFSTRARRGDIDLNGHVNNVHYVEWLVEALPEGAGTIADLELAYKSETLAGDAVIAEAVEVEPRVWAARVAAPDGANHVVARLTLA